VIASSISLVIEPPEEEAIGIHTPAKEMFALDAFAKAVGDAMGISVPVIEAPLNALPTAQLILLHRTGSLRKHLAAAPDRTKLAERIFLLDVGRQHLPDLLEELGLAGAIESYRYMSWRNHPNEDFGGQVYGRRDIANKLGGVIEPPPFSGDKYCLFDVPGTHDLPGALATYLRAYWRTVLGAP
jgi:hypothetical protein